MATLVKLGKDDIEVIAQELRYAADNGYPVTVWIDGDDGFKVKVGEGCWSPGFVTEVRA